MTTTAYDVHVETRQAFLCCEGKCATLPRDDYARPRYTPHVFERVREERGEFHTVHRRDVLFRCLVCDWSRVWGSFGLIYASNVARMQEEDIEL